MKKKEDKLGKKRGKTIWSRENVVSVVAKKHISDLK